MSKTQRLSIVAFFIVLVCIYLFGKTKDPEATERSGNPAIAEQANQVFDIDAYLLNIRQSFSGEQQFRAEQLDSLLKASGSDASMLIWLDSTISFYTENKKLLALAHFQMMKAKEMEVFLQWKRAGDAYALLAGNQNMPPDMYAHISGNGIEAYQNALELEPESAETKISLASMLMESEDQVMNGVQLLLGVVRQDPDNAPANLLLGKYGVISGQFEKAISRLENVVSSQPENAEALFLLAEAYNGSGNKDQAIATFEKCKQLINNDAFRKEIDNYIESINNR